MRLINEFATILDPTLQTGTFVGARLDTESEDKLVNWLQKTGLQNTEPRENIHITIIGDKKRQFPWKPRKYAPLEIDPSTMSIDLFGEDEYKALVLRFESPELEERHLWGKDTYGIDWKFPEYNPHITLGYDTGVEPGRVPIPDFPLFVAGEYAQPWGRTVEDRAVLRPNWNRTLYEMMHGVQVG